MLGDDENLRKAIGYTLYPKNSTPEQKALQDKAIYDYYFKEIDELGGVIPAIEKGYFQREIARSASEYQKKIDEGSLIHVGVNKYIKNNEELEIPTLEIGEETEKIQKERIDNIRNKRDNNLVKKSLNAIKNACANSNNIMIPIINATKDDGCCRRSS